MCLRQDCKNFNNLINAQKVARLFDKLLTINNKHKLQQAYTLISAIARLFDTCYGINLAVIKKRSDLITSINWLVSDFYRIFQLFTTIGIKICVDANYFNCMLVKKCESADFAQIYTPVESWKVLNWRQSKGSSQMLWVRGVSDR